MDVKARKESYRIGTEGRKFIESIQREIPKLRKKRHKKYYFGLVSSKYQDNTDPAIKELRLEHFVSDEKRELGLPQREMELR